nr:hypothetical protein [Stagnihabitans tardus]
MTRDPAPRSLSPKAARDQRLKAALKANMGRRKAQTRARAEAQDPEDQTQTGGETPKEKE